MNTFTPDQKSAVEALCAYELGQDEAGDFYSFDEGEGYYLSFWPLENGEFRISEVVDYDGQAKTSNYKTFDALMEALREGF